MAYFIKAMMRRFSSSRNGHGKGGGRPGYMALSFAVFLSGILLQAHAAETPQKADQARQQLDRLRASCAVMRGVRKPGAVCVTSAMKGAFRSNPSTRAEIMTLIYGNRR